MNRYKIALHKKPPPKSPKPKEWDLTSEEQSALFNKNMDAMIEERALDDPRNFPRIIFQNPQDHLYRGWDSTRMLESIREVLGQMNSQREGRFLRGPV
jgi:hypothetical protein